MQVPTIFTILSVAFAAVAMPSTHVERSGPTVGPGGNAACGNGQVISCCNTNSVSSGEGGLLGLGGALDGVLGGSCSPLNIPIIAILVPVEKACGDNMAACCTGDANGLVNVACTNVGVL